MSITPYQAKYYAYELTKRCPSNSVEKLSATLVDAQVDLNPHQIEAALFAFKSPLSKGAILADEVGLGKTIEAGILLSQQWAERKRKLLIICPSSLRKQWSQELMDKFFLPSIILESKSFNQFQKAGKKNPFDQNKIVICSYHFASNKAEFVQLTRWDLAVIDEAHKLRNVYRPSNKIANTIKSALAQSRKVLLTATPLQNSLSELYGLVSIIDDHTFGDYKSFKSQFSRLNNDDEFVDLKERLSTICKRNLRRQVQEYINYTSRIPLTINFTPNKDEQALYDMVSDYLQRPNLYALPNSQRHLITLILRKLLASSSYAIARTLGRLADKLQHKLKSLNVTESYNDVIEDYDPIGEIEEEIDEMNTETEVFTQADIAAIEREIEELTAFRDLAESIVHNAKGEKLKTALQEGFSKAQEFGADKKALIFTESQRTQQYLKTMLDKMPEYKGKIVLFNGQNNSEEANSIYKHWLSKYEGTDVISGAKSADIRAALVDYFKNEATIMIATEAAAEGINLQFCSLLINYDLPWNPQRIEQRIGRCHRYGQKFDVVVVNFVNTNNAADQRVFELLNEKFNLFSGVFGASDEVLGTIESGVDFEKRIAEIYQNCRTKEEIQRSFDDLQQEMEEQISSKMQTTRQKLLDHFDEEVVEKLKVTLAESEAYLNKYEQWLWSLTQLGLQGHAEFENGSFSFRLKKNPFDSISIPTGKYRFAKNVADAHYYRLGHPLAQQLIEQFKNSELNEADLTFDYSGSPTNVSILKPLIKKSGKLAAYCLTVSALDTEDYLLFATVTDEGKELDHEQSQRLLTLPVINNHNGLSGIETQELKSIITQKKKKVLAGINERNTTFFEEELEKLDKWAEDKRNSLKLTLKELDEEIKELKKNARTARSLPDKLALRKKVKAKEVKRDEAWREYDLAGREIEKQKDELIDRIEQQLEQKTELKKLFTIKWTIK
ncbi:MAG: DEAD/DEAH box helicase [Flavobacteriales bacterium]|nr:DEAD/DEAH box helicase [Flavobacteriales bacterium]